MQATPKIKNKPDENNGHSNPEGRDKKVEGDYHETKNIFSASMLLTLL
jgi:hypothetical protein